jgi:hypothetical protein
MDCLVTTYALSSPAKKRISTATNSDIPKTPFEIAGVLEWVGIDADFI